MLPIHVYCSVRCRRVLCDAFAWLSGQTKKDMFSPKLRSVKKVWNVTVSNMSVDFLSSLRKHGAAHGGKNQRNNRKDGGAFAGGRQAYPCEVFPSSVRFSYPGPSKHHPRRSFLILNSGSPCFGMSVSPRSTLLIFGTVRLHGRTGFSPPVLSCSPSRFPRFSRLCRKRSASPSAVSQEAAQGGGTRREARNPCLPSGCASSVSPARASEPAVDDAPS